VSTWPIALDFDKFSASLLELVKQNGHVRLSAMVLEHWCGSAQPTARVHAWCEANRLEVMPGGDFLGGWEFRPVGLPAPDGRLF